MQESVSSIVSLMIYQPFLCQIARLLRVSLVRHTCMCIVCVWWVFFPSSPFPQAPPSPLCPRLEPILTVGIRRTMNRVIIIIIICCCCSPPNHCALGLQVDCQHIGWTSVDMFVCALCALYVCE